MKRHLKNHFIPHAGNNHIPNSLSERVVLIMLILAMSLYLLPNIFRAITVRTYAYAAIVPLVIIDITNEERVKNGLPALSVNDKLMLSSKYKSEDMATNQYFAHDSPSGVYPWKFFSEAKYDYRFGGENLAIYFTESKDVVKGWMNSPTHRENVLDKRFEDIGVSFTSGVFKGYNTDYIVQHFGTLSNNILNIEDRPAMSAIESEIIYDGDKKVEYKRLKEPVIMTKAELDAISDDTQINSSIKVEKKTEFVKVVKVVNPETLNTNIVATTSSSTQEENKYELITSIKEIPSNDNTGDVNSSSTNANKILIPQSTLFQRLFIFPENISKIALTLLLIYSVVSIMFLFLTELKHHHYKHMGYGVMLVLIIITTHLSL